MPRVGREATLTPEEHEKKEKKKQTEHKKKKKGKEKRCEGVESVSRLIS